MKKIQKSEEFPFVNDPLHIYNLLVEEGYNNILVGHSTYEFELHSNIKFNGNECDGVTHFNEKKIQLEMGLDNQTARETIFHEILHCLLHSIGVDERNFDGVNISLSNEFLTDAISKQMMAFNFHNPGLIGLLFQHEL